MDNFETVIGKEGEKSKASLPSIKDLQKNKFTPTTGFIDSVQGHKNNEESKYGEDITPETNLNEIRGERQSTGEKYKNGLMRMAGTAATSFLEGTIGAAIGVTEALATGDSTKLYNNEFGQALDSVNESLSNAAPIYYTEEQQKSILNANFIPDKLFNGAGYMLGAIGAGYAGGQILGGLGKLALAGKLLPESLTAADSLGNLLLSAKGTRLANATQNIVVSALAAHGESAAEARGARKETLDSLIKKYKASYGEPDEKALGELQRMADAAGNVDYLVNLAVVGGTEFLQFGKLMTSGFKTNEKAFNKIIRDASKEVGEQYAAKKVSQLGNIIRKTSPYTSGILEEGGQEGIQYQTEIGVNDYYTRKFDKDSWNTLSETIDSLKNSFIGTINSKEGIESMLLGAMLGGGGQGVKELITGESRKKEENTNRVLKLLNENHLEQIVNKLTTAAQLESYEKDKTIALQNKDIFQYKNLEFDQFKTYVKSRLDADQYSSLIQELDEQKQLTDDEFKEKFGFPKEQPLPKDKVTLIEELKKKAESIKEIQESIDSKFPQNKANSGLSDAQFRFFKDNLFHIASSLDNVNKRVQEISKKASSYSTTNNVIRPFDFQAAANNVEYEEGYVQRLENLAREIFEVANEKKNINPLDSKIDELINYGRDILELGARRAEFIEFYNKLQDPKKVVTEYDSIFDKLEKEQQDKVTKERQDKIKSIRDKFTNIKESIFGKKEEEPTTKPSDEEVTYAEEVREPTEPEVKKEEVKQPKVEKTQPEVTKTSEVKPATKEQLENKRFSKTDGDYTYNYKIVDGKPTVAEVLYKGKAISSDSERDSIAAKASELLPELEKHSLEQLRDLVEGKEVKSEKKESKTEKEPEGGDNSTEGQETADFDELFGKPNELPTKKNKEEKQEQLPIQEVTVNFDEEIQAGYTLDKTSFTTEEIAKTENKPSRLRWMNFVNNFKGNPRDYMFQVITSNDPSNDPSYDSLLDDKEKEEVEGSKDIGIKFILVDSKTKEPIKVKLTGKEIQSKLQEIEKESVVIPLSQDKDGKLNQSSEEIIRLIKAELNKTSLPYKDVVSNESGSTYKLITTDNTEIEILKLLKSGGGLIRPTLTKANWINHLIKNEKDSLYSIFNSNELLTTSPQKNEKLKVGSPLGNDGSTVISPKHFLRKQGVKDWELGDKHPEWQTRWDAEVERKNKFREQLESGKITYVPIVERSAGVIIKKENGKEVESISPAKALFEDINQKTDGETPRYYIPTSRGYNKKTGKDEDYEVVNRKTGETSGTTPFGFLGNEEHKLKVGVLYAIKDGRFYPLTSRKLKEFEVKNITAAFAKLEKDPKPEIRKRAIENYVYFTDSKKNYGENTLYYDFDSKTIHFGSQVIPVTEATTNKDFEEFLSKRRRQVNNKLLNENPSDILTIGDNGDISKSSMSYYEFLFASEDKAGNSLSPAFTIKMKPLGEQQTTGNYFVFDSSKAIIGEPIKLNDEVIEESPFKEETEINKDSKVSKIQEYRNNYSKNAEYTYNLGYFTKTDTGNVVILGRTGIEDLEDFKKKLETGYFDGDNRLFPKHIDFTEAKEEVKPRRAPVERRNKKGLDSNEANLYRIKGENKNYKIEDLTKAKEWFKSRFNGSDFTVTKELIDGKAFGQFYNGVVYLFEKAEEGTVYHEAFHKVTQQYLTEKQRHQLYDEYKTAKNNWNLTDNEVEEKLAEEFREFVLTGQKAVLGRPVKNTLFRRLYNYIKSLFTGTTSIEQIYLKLASKEGYSKDKTVADSTSKKWNRAIFNMSETRTKLWDDSIRGILFDSLLESGFTPNQLTTSKKKEELLAKAYETTYDKLLDKYEDENTPQDIADELLSILNNYDDYIEHHKASINSIISVTTKKNVEKQEEQKKDELDEENNSEELNEEEVKPKDEFTPSNEISTVSTINNNTKVLLVNLKQRDSNGEVILNELGEPARVDFNETYKYLLNSLKNLSTPSSGYSKLKDLEKENPDIKSLLEVIIEPSKWSTLSDYQFKVQTDFWQDFNKSESRGAITVIDPETGNIYTTDANRNNLEGRIKIDWQNDLVNSKYFDRDANTLTKDILDITEPVEFLRNIGITVDGLTDEEFENQLNNKDFSNIRRTIEEALNEGILVNDLYKLNTNTNLNNILDIAAKNSKKVIELSYTNAEGKRIYAITLNNYYSIVANGINNSATWEDFIKEFPQFNTVSAKGSVWFSRMFDKDGNRNKIRFEIRTLAGVKVNGDNDSGITTTKADVQTKFIQEFNDLFITGQSSTPRPSDKSSDYAAGLVLDRKEALEIPVEEIKKNQFSGKKVRDIFENYFLAELERIQARRIDGVGKNIDIYGVDKIDKDTKKPIPDSSNAANWTIFEDILSEKTKESLKSYLGKSSIKLSKEQESAIDYVFKSNPEVESLFGSNKELYQKYINGIFPESKIKDIVYRGLSNKSDNEIKDFTYFTASKSLAEDYIERQRSSWENSLLDEYDYKEIPDELWHSFKPVLIQSLINIKNPYESNEGIFDLPINDSHDSSIGLVKDVTGLEPQILVYNKEAIHILGSKEDITKATEWLKSNNTVETEPTKDILDSVNKDVIDFLERQSVGTSIYGDSFGSTLGMLNEHGLSKGNGISTDLFDNGNTIEDLARAFTVNHLIQTIEHIKIFYGDKAFYKDFYKRTSAAIGTKKFCMESADLDKFINDNRTFKDLWEDVQSEYESDKDAKVAIIQDNMTKSDRATEYVELKTKRLVAAGMSEEDAREQAEETMSAYFDMNEADAQSYSNPIFHRHMLIKASLWDFDLQEKQYKYEMANFYLALHNRALESAEEQTKKYGRTYEKFEIKDTEKLAEIQKLAEKNPNGIINVQKAQYFGSQNSKQSEGLNAPTFHKYSISPLTWRLVEDTNLEDKLISMIENQVGYLVFESGVKVGATVDDNGNKNQFYDEEGNSLEFNEDSIYQSIPYRYLGIQVEMKPKAGEKNIFGTQFRKLILANLFNGGNIQVEELKEFHAEYLGIIKSLVNEEWEKLKSDLGVKLNSKDELESMDLTKLVKILRAEGEGRQLADNLINALDTNEDKSLKYSIDSLVTRPKLEVLMMSLVSSRVSRQHMPGDAMPQLANTGYEPKGSRKGKVGKSNKLLSYRKDPVTGKTLPMQVIVPLNAQYKELLKVYGSLKEVNKAVKDGRIDKRILTMVGYRIPTQGLNSIEFMEIVGFISDSLGNSIILPSEIVAKSGGDFDIDKLNIFRPNFKVNGLVEFINSEQKRIGEATKTEYKTYTDSEIDDLLNLEEDTDESTFIKGIADRFKGNSIKYIDSKESKQGKQNRIIEISKSILEHPYMYEQLITPNSTNDLDDNVTRIRYARYQKSGGKLSYEEFTKQKLDKKVPSHTQEFMWGHIMNQFRDFLGGKKAIGGDAVNITAHTLFQQAGTKISADKVQINIVANRDENKNIILGGVYNQSESKKLISDIQSQLANLHLDAAKDPKYKDLNATEEMLSTLHFFEHIGVPEDVAYYFLNQPIIYELLKREHKSILDGLSTEEEGFKEKGSDILRKEYAKRLGLKEDKNGNYEYDKKVIGSDVTADDLLAQISGEQDDLLQLQILEDFLNYKDYAGKLGGFIKLLNYDTTKFKDLASLDERLEGIKGLSDTTLLTRQDYEDIVNGTVVGSFNKVKGTKSMFSHLFEATENEKFKDVRTAIMEEVKPKKKLREKLPNIINYDFINYLTQKFGKYEGTTVSNHINRLFFGENTLAKQLKGIKEIVGKNTLLDELQAILSGEPNNIGIYARKLTKLESDVITATFKELLNYQGKKDMLAVQKFAKDLSTFAILQSGLHNSPITFTGLVPQETIGDITQAAINRYKKLTTSNESADIELLDKLHKDFYNRFFLKNLNNSQIVPNYETQESKMFPGERELKSKLKNKQFLQKEVTERVYNKQTKKYDFNKTGEIQVFIKTAKGHGLLDLGIPFRKYGYKLQDFYLNDIDELLDFDSPSDSNKPSDRISDSEIESELESKNPIVESKEEVKVASNQYKLPNGKVITFNKQQVEALDNIESWYDSKEQFFTLNGYAGTGKTTIVKKFLDGKYAIVSAPTHKARKVIEKTTGRESFTIQKLLGLKPNVDIDNFDINNPQFDPLSEAKIPTDGLLIIDEASMLNKDLFDLLIDIAKESNTKVLFMGDEAQLPPINEKSSKVFTSEEITSKSLLTKVERQADGNPLATIYDAIRNNIDSKFDVFEHKSNVNSKGEGIIFTQNKAEVVDKINEMFTSEEYKANADYVKVLAWTNKAVGEWNQIVRSKITDTSSWLNQGEILISYTQTNDGLENSTDYKVTSIQDGEYQGIKVKRVVLKDTSDSNNTISTHILEPTTENEQLFAEQVYNALQQAKRATGQDRKGAWKNYYAIRESRLLMRPIQYKDQTFKKDFDYGYAVTVHKSQGSTYTNVIVDDKDISNNQKNTERNQIKYVALSRPTNLAVVLSNKALGSDNRMKAKEALESGKSVEDIIMYNDGFRLSAEELTSIANELNSMKNKEQNTMNPKDFTNFSGAAQGSDTEWMNIGKEFGIETTNFRPQDLSKYNKEAQDRIEAAYQQAAKDLGRKALDATTYAGGLVRRDFLQAAYADAVFAIGNIMQVGEKNSKGYPVRSKHASVDGGTGYAVQMGINLGKPVNVFNQRDSKWYKWNYETNKFEEQFTPTLTPKFAGVGTRELLDSGKQAIRGVYENTFGKTNSTDSKLNKPSDDEVDGLMKECKPKQ